MDAPAEVKAVADKYIGPNGTPGANRLPVLARQINAAIREEKAQERKADDYAKKSQDARKAAMEWRLKIGAYLVEAKALVLHGQWLSWLRDNCALQERTAQNYMRLVAKKDNIESNTKPVSDLGVKAALKLIAKPRATEAQAPEPQQLDIEDAIDASIGDDYDPENDPFAVFENAVMELAGECEDETLSPEMRATKREEFAGSLHNTIHYLRDIRSDCFDWIEKTKWFDRRRNDKYVASHCCGAVADEIFNVAIAVTADARKALFADVRKTIDELESAFIAGESAQGPTTEEKHDAQ